MIARDRVLFIPELLEAILLEVDILTRLSAAQRVCQKMERLDSLIVVPAASPLLQALQGKGKQSNHDEPCSRISASSQIFSKFIAAHLVLTRIRIGSRPDTSAYK